MSLAIDGLISGLNTTQMIDSLMKIEAIPQTLLKNKVATSQNFVSSLQTLNTRVAALTELAAKTAKPVAFELYTSTSSSDAVTLTTGAGVAPGRLDILVDSLATAQTSVTEPLTVWPDSPPALTIVRADGTSTEITPKSSSLDDVVSALNAADTGVVASKIAVGADGFRIQLTAKASGADAAFTVHRGTAAGVADGTAPVLPTTTISTGTDASLKLWAGTAAEQTITSSSNTFPDLLPGVTATLTAKPPAAVSITVQKDDAKVSEVAASLVKSVNDVFSFIDAQSKVSTSTGSTGSTTVTSGLLAGDGTVRTVDQQLLAAASRPIGGRSPSELGITLTKTGTMEFDSAKFAAAHAKDPAGTEAFVHTLADRISAVGKGISDKYDGVLTGKITGQQKSVRVLGEQVEGWDRRLDSRRTILERTYAALEVSLSKLNSQSSWLSGQLSSLSTGSSS
ncbi:flagellar filament capping protein FliD [Planctomonas psychrotolerans]|uniref:flagellar filament capping protein FliD n=1 Tax=Planctomonas psychrotolerans TaxID=2528712 RepID=UPI00123C658F|nr:flagellar filament capping protein FliD [Planctomonas psychrotolerans]